MESRAGKLTMSLTTSVFAFALVSFAGAGAWGASSCADASGDLRYSGRSRLGDSAPSDGYELFYKGVSVKKVTVVYPNQFEPRGWFEDSSPLLEVFFSNPQEQAVGKSSFELSAHSPAGTPVFPGMKESSAKFEMLCTEAQMETANGR